MLLLSFLGSFPILSSPISENPRGSMKDLYTKIEKFIYILYSSADAGDLFFICVLLPPNDSLAKTTKVCELKLKYANLTKKIIK